MSARLCPIGINIDLAYIDDYRTLVQELQATQPSVCVATIDNENDAGIIFNLQQQLPNTKIVARVNRKGDAGYHEPGGDEGWAMSPRTFLKNWGYLGQNGLTLNALNEPSGYSIFDRLVKWTLELIRLASEQNISLTVLNFGTGNPAEDMKRDEWVTVFDPVLIALSDRRDLHYLGLHEYLPGEGWRVGRFQKMIRRCAVIKHNGTVGIKPPRIIITEFGVDEDHGGSVVNGFRSRGWSEVFYARTLIDMINRWYAKYIQDGTLIGLAVFVASRNWSAFNVEHARTFHKVIREECPRFGITLPDPKPPVVEEPPKPEAPCPELPDHTQEILDISQLLDVALKAVALAQSKIAAIQE